MCGRYTLHHDSEQIIRRYLLDRWPADLRPRYNIAPTQQVPVIRVHGGAREMVMMRWGLVPSWAKDPSIGNRMINARAEGVAQKPAFRNALKHRRCLIPASGFYEWCKDKGGKKPMYIRREDGEPFAFAGLWESWADKTTGQDLLTCTIITTLANELVRPIHDRMPVILGREDEAAWLDTGRSEAADVVPMLRSCPVRGMVAHAVSKRVNKPENEGAGLVEEVGGEEGEHRALF